MSTTKRRAKYLLAFVAAAVLALAMAVPAFAANTGSITINPPTNSQSTDSHTYQIFKVFNAVASDAGISYTTLDGVKDADVITATDNLSKFAADSAGNVLYYTRTSTGAEWVLNTSENAPLSKPMIDAIGAYITAKNISATTTASSTGTNPAVASNLANGYYYIKTSTGTVVTVDSTKPDAEVNDKNTLPTIKKEIQSINNGGVVSGSDNETGDGKIGDTVTYKVTIDAKPGAVNYIFHDKVSAGLSLEPAALANTNITATANKGGTPQFTVVYWSDTDATNQTDTEPGDNITVRFSNDYLATITEDTTITVTYTVKINDNAVIGNAGNPNEVVLEYGHNPTDTSNPNEPNNKTEKDEVKVYTYAIALKKVNTQAEELDGAVFQLPFYVKETPAADGSYIYAGTAAGTGLVNTLTTPANGTITIKGLQDNKQYSITETTPPEGYNKLTAAIVVTPVKTSTATTKITKYLDAEGNVTDTVTETVVEYTPVEAVPVSAFETVVNKQGVELPSTGGIGTTILYIIGGILVLGAVVFLITKRRMAKVNIESDDTI